MIYALIVMRRLVLKKTEYEDIIKWNTRVLVARKKKRVQLRARSVLKWLAEIREKEAQTCIEGVKRSARLEVSHTLHHCTMHSNICHCSHSCITLSVCLMPKNRKR